MITARRGRVVLWQRVFGKIGTMSLAQHSKNEVEAIRESGSVVGPIALDVTGSAPAAA